MNEPQNTTAERRIIISPSMLGEIYDAMDGARYDANHGLANDLNYFDDCILSLSEKLCQAPKKGSCYLLELTRREIRRLIYELGNASERLLETEPGMSREMNRKIDQLTTNESETE